MTSNYLCKIYGEFPNQNRGSRNRSGPISQKFKYLIKYNSYTCCSIHMKIDSLSFNFITFLSFNSIYTIFSDLSNSRHWCCLNLFYSKFYLFHGFHGLASNLAYITPNMIMISHSNG